MERAFLARDSLHDHPRILIDENAHKSLSSFSPTHSPWEGLYSFKLT
jgi:hypothetical protein